LSGRVCSWPPRRPRSSLVCLAFLSSSHLANISADPPSLFRHNYFLLLPTYIYTPLSQQPGYQPGHQLGQQPGQDCRQRHIDQGWPRNHQDLPWVRHIPATRFHTFDRGPRGLQILSCDLRGIPVTDTFLHGPWRSYP
jgi:hypothetical protein